MSDTIASVKLTEAQATRNASIQKRGFKTPDLIIFAPRGIYHGLFIELKTKTPYKRDGTLLENAHLKAQEETIQNLRNLGYYADFKWDLQDAVKLIDWYLNLKTNED
ncbi:VRR-NUC domain-containing protein [Chryseobacterium lathyri]|uniref:VRR-NUC domain-containing protein n=1 Tax=Chryseobacterium lathyri TaxID=395933 RepID=UPI001CBB0F04|nr:VRR-NUC domain-containing protein [Chryseobacterium lathyri]